MSRQQLEDERRADLVWRVADADVEVWELRLDDIAEQDIEPLLRRRTLHPLGQFGSHARIHFDGDAFAGFLQDAGCEVAGSWADFEDDVRLFEVGFGYYCVCNAWILENVLTGDFQRIVW
jgi:hypothetical protein